MEEDEEEEEVLEMKRRREGGEMNVLNSLPVMEVLSEQLL